MPVFALFLCQMLFRLQTDVRKVADTNCLAMLICAIVAFVTFASSKFSFGVIGENVTMKIR